MANSCTQNGAAVMHKAIFWDDVPLHRSCIDLRYKKLLGT